MMPPRTCRFWQTSPEGPDVYVMTPPPLMADRAYGMNQTVINQVGQLM